MKNFEGNLITICLLIFVVGTTVPAKATIILENDEDAKADCPGCVAAPKEDGSTLPSGSPAKKKAPERSNLIGDAQGRVETAIGYLPEETRKAVTTYMDIMKLGEYHGHDSEVGTSNAGLGSTTQEMYDAPEANCFRSAAHDFYAEIDRISRREHPYKTPKPEDFGGPSRDRPTLQRSAGQGEEAKLEPGWVWDTALRHAHGDANVAMKLIGLCGNDDTQLPFFTHNDKSPKALEEEENRIRKLEATKKDLTAQLAEAYRKPDDPLSDVEFFKYKLRSIEAEMKPRSKRAILDCPEQASDFYLAKGLGEKADISQELKDKILAVQGQTGHADMIPSKYYHVYGSAFVACEMIERGVAPNKVTETAELAARAYRGIRICNAVQKLSDEQTKLEAVFDPQHSAPTGEKLNAAFDDVSAKLAKDPKACFNALENSELGLNCYRFMIKMAPDAAKRLSFTRARLDAAKLYSAWTLGGQKVGGMMIPCSNVHILGPKDRMNPTESWFDRLSQPLGWSKERYTAASRMVATWDADFEWTVAQHKIGAKFAKAVCKKKDGPTDYSALCHDASKYVSTKKSGPSSGPAPAKSSTNLETKSGGE